MRRTGAWLRTATAALPALAGLTAAVGQDSAAPADMETLARGAQVYEHWCLPCHAPGRPGAAALEFKYGGDLPGVLVERTDLTPEVIAAFVRNGVSVMTPFRKTEIDDDELAALALYVASASERDAMESE